MAKNKIKTKATPTLFPPLFNLSELAASSGVDYHRLFHVCKGNRVGGFTPEEKAKLEVAVLSEAKKFLTILKSSKSPLVNTIDPTLP